MFLGLLNVVNVAKELLNMILLSMGIGIARPVIAIITISVYLINKQNLLSQSYLGSELIKKEIIKITKDLPNE